MASSPATFPSSLSSPITSIRCLATNLKHATLDPFLVKFCSTRNKSYTPLSFHQHCCYYYYYGNEPVSKWRAPPQVAATVSVAEETTVDNGEAEIASEDIINTKLYFGNLPYLCDSAQLAGIVQQYATPELVEVLYNRETGKSRGFAFVTMSSVEDCNAVIENLDGSEYGGRLIRVNYADKPRKREALYPETEHKLFVGNLSWSVTSESLYQAFHEFGNVVGARVLYDGETGRSRGYGFVSYASRTEMENALTSLNGMSFMKGQSTLKLTIILLETKSLKA